MLCLCRYAFVPAHEPGVTLQEQFGSMTVLIKKPALLCNPVDKNGEDATAPTHPIHLIEQGQVRFGIPVCDLGQTLQSGLEALNFLVPLPLGLEKAVLLGLNLFSLGRGFQAVVEDPGKLHEIIP